MILKAHYARLVSFKSSRSPRTVIASRLFKVIPYRCLDDRYHVVLGRPGRSHMRAQSSSLTLPPKLNREPIVSGRSGPIVCQ